MSSDATRGVHRRDFGKTLLTGALGGTVFSAATGATAAAEPASGKRRQSGVKLAIQMNHFSKDPLDPTEEEFAFVKALGVGHVTIWVGPDRASAEHFKAAVKRYASAGVKIWNIGNYDVHNIPEVTLNLPGRDRKIEQYLQYLHNMHEAGLTYTTYAHMGNGIWSTGRDYIRGAPARVFDLDEAREGRWLGTVFRGPLTHGRRFSEKEIWDNYAYFIKRVVPVAEKLGIRIGIHPDDPPCVELGGVPRCIFGTFEGYRKALEIADSDQIGICLCCGCWLEGGPQMGKNVLEAIRYFGQRGKIFKVHFRNVDAPLPRFTETFLDNGYMDMYQVMKALVEVDFDGVAIPDHIPRLARDSRVGVAYSIAYMRALLERAEEEGRV